MNLKHTSLAALLAFGLFFTSCQKDSQTVTDQDTQIQQGKGRLNINLSGADYATTKDKKNNIQHQQIRLADGTIASISLESISAQSTISKRASNRAATTVENALSTGTYYGILLYNGNTPAMKPLQIGATDQNVDLAPGTYKAIIYSRGSNESASLTTNTNFVTWGQQGFYDISSKQGHFMVFPTETFEIKEGEATTISATLVHQFSEINVNVTLPSSVAANAAITGSIASDKITSYTPFETTQQSFGQTETQEFTLAHVGNAATGKVVVGGTTERTLTLNIGGKTLTVPNVRVTPGERYNLNINLVGEDNIIKVPEDITGETGESILLYENDLRSTNGFEIDITDLDNSFAVQVNDQHVFTAEITIANTPFTYHDMQFQGRENGELVAYNNKAYPANLKFEDGSVWGANGVASIWEQAHTNWNKPTVRLKVDGEGNVTLFGSKTAGGELHKLVTVTGENGTNTSRLDNNKSYSYNVTSRFNKVTWNKGASNKVKISMVDYDKNRFNGMLNLKN
ncbi:MAG: hypothetical protein ACN6PI_08760 [Sphingobacterium siyangense]